MRIPSEGCWKSSCRLVYRHAEGCHSYAFEVWSEDEREWCKVLDPGSGPWTPCEDPSVDNAPRDMSPDVRRWLRENAPRKLRKKVVGGKRLIWWDEALQQFLQRGSTDPDGYCAPDNASDSYWAGLVTDDGKGW